MALSSCVWLTDSQAPVCFKRRKMKRGKNRLVDTLWNTAHSIALMNWNSLQEVQGCRMVTSHLLPLNQRRKEDGELIKQNVEFRGLAPTEEDVMNEPKVELCLLVLYRWYDRPCEIWTNYSKWDVENTKDKSLPLGPCTRNRKSLKWRVSSLVRCGLCPLLRMNYAGAFLVTWWSWLSNIQVINILVISFKYCQSGWALVCLQLLTLCNRTRIERKDHTAQFYCMPFKNVRLFFQSSNPVNSITKSCYWVAHLPTNAEIHFLVVGPLACLCRKLQTQIAMSVSGNCPWCRVKPTVLVAAPAIPTGQSSWLITQNSASLPLIYISHS